MCRPEWSASTPIRNQSSLPRQWLWHLALEGTASPKTSLRVLRRKKLQGRSVQRIQLCTARSSQADVSVGEGGLVAYSVKSGAVETSRLSTVEFMLQPNCRLELRCASEECCRAD